MQTRAEAIKYLQAHGYEAFERDWALGQSIGIPVGRKREEKVGDQTIRIWDGVVYIFPVDEQWAINDLSTAEISQAKYPSLLEAVLEAEKIVVSKSLPARD